MRAASIRAGDTIEGLLNSSSGGLRLHPNRRELVMPSYLSSVLMIHHSGQNYHGAGLRFQESTWPPSTKSLRNAYRHDWHESLITSKIGKTTTMGNGGEYLSSWPRSEPWHDPIASGGSNVAAVRPEGITAKGASDGVAEDVRIPGGYSAAEAAQDARNGAWLIAWPTGERWDASSTCVSAVKKAKTANRWVQRPGGLGLALTRDIGQRPDL